MRFTKPLFAMPFSSGLLGFLGLWIAIFSFHTGVACAQPAVALPPFSVQTQNSPAPVASPKPPAPVPSHGAPAATAALVQDPHSHHQTINHIDTSEELQGAPVTPSSNWQEDIEQKLNVALILLGLLTAVISFLGFWYWVNQPKKLVSHSENTHQPPQQTTQPANQQTAQPVVDLKPNQDSATVAMFAEFFYLQLHDPIQAQILLDKMQIQLEQQSAVSNLAANQVAHHLACVYSLQGKPKSAIEQLEKSRQAQSLPSEKYWQACIHFIRNTPEFQAWERKHFPQGF